MCCVNQQAALLAREADCKFCPPEERRTFEKIQTEFLKISEFLNF
jgi:hypothetical protein